MLTFFRRIRKGLIEGGSTSKYLVYAIGEILLVMIGILLALQVNNWNETRKDTEKANAILEEIRQNTISNIEILEGDIQAEQKVIQSIDIVLDHMMLQRPYHDSLDEHFEFSIFIPGVKWNTAGFESLQSHGINLLGTDSLGQAIVDFYQPVYNSILEMTRLSEGMLESVIEPVIIELFKTYSVPIGFDNNHHRLKPFDYDQLLNSQKYIGVLSRWKYYRDSSISNKKFIARRAQKLVDLIEAQLGIIEIKN